MAVRYTLIMSDGIFQKLLEYASKEGISLGKLINAILQRFVADKMAEDEQESAAGNMAEPDNAEENATSVVK